MKGVRQFFNGITFGLGFLSISIMGAVYAATTYYADLPNVSWGNTLSSTTWNNLVNYANKAVKQETEVMTITGGKVGINNVNPAGKLDVNIDPLDAGAVRIFTPSLANGSFNQIKLGYWDGWFQSAAIRFGRDDTNGNYLSLFHWGESTGITLRQGWNVTASKYTTSTTWTGIPGNASWSSSVMCRRIWSFLQFGGYLAYTSGNTSGGTWWSGVQGFLWGLIPTTCRPSIGLAWISAACWTDAGTNTPCFLSISTSGDISIYNSAVFKNISFVGTYPAD